MSVAVALLMDFGCPPLRIALRTRTSFSHDFLVTSILLVHLFINVFKHIFIHINICVRLLCKHTIMRTCVYRYPQRIKRQHEIIENRVRILVNMESELWMLYRPRKWRWLYSIMKRIKIISFNENIINLSYVPIKKKNSDKLLAIKFSEKFRTRNIN